MLTESSIYSLPLFLFPILFQLPPSTRQGSKFTQHSSRAPASATMIMSPLHTARPHFRYASLSRHTALDRLRMPHRYTRSFQATVRRRAVQDATKTLYTTPKSQASEHADHHHGQLTWLAKKPLDPLSGSQHTTGNQGAAEGYQSRDQESEATSAPEQFNTYPWERLTVWPHLW
jgi:hypothetical protein